MLLANKNRRTIRTVWTQRYSKMHSAASSRDHSFVFRHISCINQITSTSKKDCHRQVAHNSLPTLFYSGMCSERLTPFEPCPGVCAHHNACKRPPADIKRRHESYTHPFTRKQHSYCSRWCSGGGLLVVQNGKDVQQHTECSRWFKVQVF